MLQFDLFETPSAEPAPETLSAHKLTAPADLVVLNMGAGRQSVTLLALAIAGELPRPDVVIHADTGDERPGTLRYIDQVIRPRCEAAGIPFLVVRNGNLAKDALRSVEFGGHVTNAPYWTPKNGPDKPGSPLKRACTPSYKIFPIETAIRRQLGVGTNKAGKGLPIHTKAHPYWVEQWIGIATEESRRAKGNRLPCRHKDLHTGEIKARKVGTCSDHVTGRPHPWSRMRYPLLELGLSTQDCIATLKRLGWPVPVKSACISCPFRTDGAWLAIQRDEPETWAAAVDFDIRLRYPDGDGRLNRTPSNLTGADFPAFVHPSCKPLGEVELIDKGDGEDFGGAFC